MTKHYVCCTPYLSKHTSYDCVFCCKSLKWWHLQMLFSFFQNVGFLDCKGVGVKGQKMAQNDKIFLSKSVSQELYFIWLWLLVHMSKIMISPVIFFFFNFFKILIFQVFQSSSINTERKFWGVHHLLHMCVTSGIKFTCKNPP